MSIEEQDLPQFPSDEEVDQMGVTQGSDSKPVRTTESILASEDDTEVFTKGLCHALALEVRDAFVRAGRSVELVYLATKDHTGIASHVLVKSGGVYFDAWFGPQTEKDVIDRWSGKTDGIIRPVQHDGWLTHPGESPAGITNSRSCLGLGIDAPYFGWARERAARFVARYRARFGLHVERDCEGSISSDLRF